MCYTKYMENKMLKFLKQPNIKFDLHIHTNHSDGNAELKDIIKLANEKNLEYISITDHNTLDAYAELRKNNNYGFAGKIITGVELNVLASGYYIELLAYDFDVEKMKKWKFLNKNVFIKNNKKILKEVVSKAENLGFKLTKNLQYTNKKGLYFKELYADIVKHEENQPLLKELGVTKYRDFLRKQIFSPKGKLYVLVKNSLPSAKQVCDYVHACGGKVVLAHPFYYDSIAGENIIRTMLAYDIDGIECAHFSHTPEQIDYALSVCADKGLIVTGGSDFHNKKRYVKNKEVKSDLGYLNMSKQEVNTNILKKCYVDKNIE